MLYPIETSNLKERSYEEYFFWNLLRKSLMDKYLHKINNAKIRKISHLLYQILALGPLFLENQFFQY